MKSVGPEAMIGDSMPRHLPSLIACDGLLRSASDERLVELYGERAAAFDLSPIPIQTPGQDQFRRSRFYHHGGETCESNSLVTSCVDFS